MAIEHLTIKEAREILGLSETTLRHLFKQGVLEGFTTPGGHRRFSKSSVLAYKKSKTTLPVVGITFKNKE